MRVAPDRVSGKEIRRFYYAMLKLLDKPAGIRAKVVVRADPGQALSLGEGCVMPLWLARKLGLLECLGATKARQQLLIATAVAALNDAHDFDREMALRAGAWTARAQGVCDDRAQDDGPTSLDRLVDALNENRQLKAKVDRLQRKLAEFEAEVKG